MAPKTPLPIAVLAGIVSAVYLLSAMALLSSIIIWLALEFSAEFPSALAFVIGILSLLAGLLSILMVGIARLKRNLGFVFLLFTVIIIFACIGLMVPFVLSFVGTSGDDVIGEICDDCDEDEETQPCVDECKDECCFREFSEPIVIVFISCTAVSFLTSIVGLGVAIAHLYYARDSNTRKQR